MKRRVDLMESPSARPQPPLMRMHCAPRAERHLMAVDPTLEVPTAADAAWLFVFIIGFLVVLSLHVH